MVYDLIPFHSEFEILKMRLNILSKHVDRFVIVEANESFNGLPKPFNFEENIMKFDKWLPQIYFHKMYGLESDVDLVSDAYKSPQTGLKQKQWIREYCMKEKLKKILTALNPNEDDMVFMGDCDEIWNPVYLKNPVDYIAKLKMYMYVYKINNMSNEVWYGTIASKWKYLKDKSYNELRANPPFKTPQYYGWHFTYQGNAKEKVERHDIVTVYGMDKGRVFENIDKGQDILGRSNVMFSKNEEFWPNYLRSYKNVYEHLCL